MVKCQHAALAILGILWLIRDLYALESDQRFPRKESDFYFDDVSTPGSYPVPVTDTIDGLPHQGIPLQPSKPNDFQPVHRRDGNKNKNTKATNDNKSEGKIDENESASKEKNVKKLLKDFVSLLLNLNDKEDSLIHQLTSYLGNEDDPPKDVPDDVEAASTMRSTQPNINLTTPATTTPCSTDEDDGDDDPEENDEGIDYTSEIPQITITNIVLNVTPNPGQHVNESQARMPALNNDKPMDDFQFQEEMGIIPNDEFIDDIINFPKYTPKNESENPKNSTEPGEIKQKPSEQSPIDENASNPIIENSTKNPISGSNEENFDKNDDQFPQAQIPSEEPWNLNQISTEGSYRIPFIPENKPNFQNQEKEVTENPMPNQQNLESQISDPYPAYQQDFFPKPISFLPRRINYDRKPTYNYEPVLNTRNPIFRIAPQFFPKIIPLTTKNYNQAQARDFKAPIIVYPQELQSQANQPESDSSSGTIPFLPKHPNDPNAALSNSDIINPANIEKNEDKIPVDEIHSDFSLKKDSNPSDRLYLDRNPQPSKNTPLPQAKNNMDDITPRNKLSIQNNSTDDSVSKENENGNLASTEFALLLNHTEMAKEQSTSTTEVSPQSPKNNFYSTEEPVPQSTAFSIRSKLIITKPFLKRNRFKKPIQQIKLNNLTPLKENQVNSTLELLLENKLNDSKLSPENKLNDSESSSENKLNDSKLSPEIKFNNSESSPKNEKNSPQESPNNQQSNIDGSGLQNSSTEIGPTSETPLNSEPSIKNPRNISLSLDSKQSTEAPEVETQSTTLPDNSNETNSEELSDYDPLSEEDSFDGTDDEEQDFTGEEEDNTDDEEDNTDDEEDNTDDEEEDNTDDEEEDNIDDSYESDNEDAVHESSDDEDAFHNITDADGSNDNDKGIKNITDKVLINNPRSDIPQNSSIRILASTESPQNQTSDLNKTSQNPPVPSRNDVNKNPQNISTPSKDDSNESPRNPPVPPMDDFDKSLENRFVPSKDESNESSQNPPESPIDVDKGNQNSKRPSAKGPPYDNILDYIYSYSKNPFFKELKKQQDRM